MMMTIVTTCLGRCLLSCCVLKLELQPCLLPRSSNEAIVRFNPCLLAVPGCCRYKQRKCLISKLYQRWWEQPEHHGRDPWSSLRVVIWGKHIIKETQVVKCRSLQTCHFTFKHVTTQHWNFGATLYGKAQREYHLTRAISMLGPKRFVHAFLTRTKEYISQECTMNRDELVSKISELLWAETVCPNLPGATLCCPGLVEGLAQGGYPEMWISASAGLMISLTSANNPKRGKTFHLLDSGLLQAKHTSCNESEPTLAVPAALLAIPDTTYGVSHDA